MQPPLWQLSENSSSLMMPGFPNDYNDDNFEDDNHEKRFTLAFFSAKVIVAVCAHLTDSSTK